MKYSLRQATKSDFERINALFVEMLQSIYKKDTVEGYREDELDYYFSGGENRIFAAEIDGRIEGFLSIEVHREPENYIYCDDFCVGERYRGQGIGTALMNAAQQYCEKLAFERIVLHVEESNTAARSFYEKRGFTLLKKDGTRLCLCKRLG